MRHVLITGGASGLGAAPASMSGDDPMMREVATRLITKAPLGAGEIAARVLDAVDARKFLIMPDRPARVAFWTKRLARVLYDRRMFATGTKIMESGNG